MPNKENIGKWIAALRSGRFKQTDGALKRRHTDGSVGHCCLGVACEVAIENGLELKVGEPRDVYGNYRYGLEGNHGVLPAEVSEWLGLDHLDTQGGNIHFKSAYRPETKTPISAVSANDSFGWSFEQIADKLEEHFGLVPEKAAA